MYSTPLGYFITIRTYGTWLPGDRRGYTHHTPDARGMKRRLSNPRLRERMSKLSQSDSFELDEDGRRTIESSVRGVCDYRDWKLHAINVRTNHAHIVVTGDTTPERMMNTFKSWGTRALRDAGLHKSEKSAWARHGSTIYLFREDELAYAIWYTMEAQAGERFALPGDDGVESSDEPAP